MYTKRVVFAPGALYEKRDGPNEGYRGWVMYLNWEPKVVDMRNRYNPTISYYQTYVIISECVLT